MLRLDEFVEAVQSRALFDDTADTLRSMRRILAALGMQLSKSCAREVAAQLPEELRPALLRSAKAESSGLEEFLRRLSLDEHLSPAQAKQRARAVLTVLAESLSPEQLDSLLAELPRGLRGLFRVRREPVSSGGP